MYDVSPKFQTVSIDITPLGKESGENGKTNGACKPGGSLRRQDLDASEWGGFKFVNSLHAVRT